MTSSTAPGACVTIERVSVPVTRPDLQLMLRPGSRQRSGRPVGARMMTVFLCGRRGQHGFTLPPDPRDRLVLAAWDDERSAREHLDRGRGDLWSRGAGEYFSALVRPRSARGSWVQRGWVEDLPSRRLSGPIAVITYGTVRWGDRRRWFLEDEPKAAAHVLGSPGLVAATGGATASLRTVATASFWEGAGSMLSMAYGRGGEHRTQLEAWRDRVGDLGFVRGEVLEARGTWRGRSLAALGRSEASTVTG